MVLGACVGPAAPDAAVCRDVVVRLCLNPVCGLVTSQLNVGADCAASLTQRLGCDAEDFAFTVPTRDRWLECRIPLVRDGASQLTHPACENVAEVLASCPDIERALKGAR